MAISQLVRLVILCLACFSGGAKAVGSDYYAWAPGHATFYGGSDGSGTEGGSCGYQNSLSLGFGVMTAAISDMIYDGGLTCGACFEVKCDGDSHCNAGTSVVVSATNESPQVTTATPGPHFDLSQPAFSTIGQEIAGLFTIQYRRVNCVKQGGILFWITGQAYWTSVLIYNVGGAGDVTKLSVKGDNTNWIDMTRNWGQNWCTGTVIQGQDLAFSVTTSDGRNLVSWGVADKNWQYGQTFQGGQF